MSNIWEKFRYNVVIHFDCDDGSSCFKYITSLEEHSTFKMYTIDEMNTLGLKPLKFTKTRGIDMLNRVTLNGYCAFIKTDLNFD